MIIEERQTTELEIPLSLGFGFGFAEADADAEEIGSTKIEEQNVISLTSLPKPASWNGNGSTGSVLALMERSVTLDWLGGAISDSPPWQKPAAAGRGRPGARPGARSVMLRRNPSKGMKRRVTPIPPGSRI